MCRGFVAAVMARRLARVRRFLRWTQNSSSRLISRLLVNKKYYLDKYEDVKIAKVDPFDHYAQTMFREPLRSPNASFEPLIIFISPLLAVLSALWGSARIDLFHILKHQIKPAYNRGQKFMPCLLGSVAALTWRYLVRRHPHLSGAGGIRFGRQDSARNWASRNGYRVREIAFETRIPVETPAVYGASDVRTRHDIESFTPYVVELPNVIGFSGSNIVLTECGWALNEAGAHPAFGRYVSHQSDPMVVAAAHCGGNRILINEGGGNRRELDRGIMLFGVASDAFGHWVPEYLTRIEFYEQHPDYASLPIVIDEGMPANHLEYLRLLTRNEIIVLKKGEQIKFGRLIYASPPTFFPVHMFPNKIPPVEIGPISPQSYRFLRDRVQASLGHPQVARERIFLGRTRMSWRRMTNEEDVANDLKTLGFKVVFPELMTVAEQIDMFQRASCIVAANGSALQNIIYSKTDVKLLILSQRNLVNWGAFAGQVGALGYRPLFVCGPEESYRSSKHSDYAIPLETIRAALRSVGEL